MATDVFGLEGQILDGQFRVEKAIGEGGFSVVYRGRHVGLDEPIAIKCLKLASSLGAQVIDSFVRRFRDESKLQYKLSQGNLSIVRAIASGTTMAPATGALVPYMVLEWLEGQTLEADFENRHGRGLQGRSMEEMMTLLDTAAEAVAFAHTQGVIHRDLNPGNFFIVKAGAGGGRPGEGPMSVERQKVRVKILDFGVAKVVSDHAMELGPRAQTLGFIRIFSPAYGAPEQFQDSLGKMGPWTDVYTFAMIALEALCDAQPYEGSNIGEYAAHALNPKVRPTPRTLGLSVSDEIEQVFARALALKPEERFHDLGEFWGALKSVVRISREQISFAAARQTPSLALPTGDDEDDVTAVKDAGELQALIERVSKNFGHASDLKATALADPPDTYREDLPTTEGELDTTVSKRMPEMNAMRHAMGGGAKTLAFSSPAPLTHSDKPPAPEAAPAPSASRSPSDPSQVTPMISKPQAALFRTLAFSNAPPVSDVQGGPASQPASHDFPAPPPVLHSEPAARMPAPPSSAFDPPTSPVAFAPQAAPVQRDPSPAAPIPLPQQQPPASQPAQPAQPAQTYALPTSTPSVPIGQAPTNPAPPGPQPAAPTTLAISGSAVALAAQYGPLPQGVLQPGGGPRPSTSAPGFPAPHAGSGAYGAASAAAGYAMPPQSPQSPQSPQPLQPQGAPHSYGQPQGPHSFQQHALQHGATVPAMGAFQATDTAEGPASPNKGRTLVLASILAIIALLAGAGGLVVFLKRGAKHPKPAPSAEAIAPTAPSAPPAAPSAPPSADPAPPPPAEPPSDPVPAAADPQPSASASAVPSATASNPRGTSPAPAVAPVPTATASAATSNFDAKAANAAAAKWGVMAASCKEKDGLGGPGTASISFAPSGDVTSVVIDPPYAGTTEGACITKLLARSKMAAYEGDPGTIRYRFSLPK